ncbi:MAG: protease inhibitor I42 family protein [Spirochaetales bacterium]|nr:protease inhibitor I42 family protein [Spirochaetales bacterium]
MKKKVFMFICLILIIAFFSSLSLYARRRSRATSTPTPAPVATNTPTPAPTSTPIAQETEIDINLNEIAEIELLENASTGYQWFYTIENPGIVVLDSEEIIQTTNDPLIAGAPHIHIWRFKGISEGSTGITYLYYRSWEGPDTAIDERVFTINVTD